MLVLLSLLIFSVVGPGVLKGICFILLGGRYFNFLGTSLSIPFASVIKVVITDLSKVCGCSPVPTEPPCESLSVIWESWDGVKKVGSLDGSFPL